MLRHGHIGHLVKMHYFFEKSSSIFLGISRQTEYRVMISMEAFTKILNFVTPGQCSCVRMWPYQSYSGNGFFFIDFLYSWLSCRETECIIILNREASNMAI